MRDISKSRLEASNSLLYKNLPHSSLLFWESEIFETVFHETLSGIHEQLEGGEQVKEDITGEIGASVLPRVHAHIANYHSRVPRPPFPLPSEQCSEIGIVQPLDGSDEYEGWFRCGYFEHEMIIDEGRNFAGFSTAMQGVEFQSEFPIKPTETPFAAANADEWWMRFESIDLSLFRGCISGLDLIKDLLGVTSIFVLPPSLSSSLGLKPSSSWQQPLTLTDHSGEVAVVFRSWRSQALGERISEERMKFVGCDLLMRSDTFELLTSQVGADYRNIKLINTG